MTVEHVQNAIQIVLNEEWKVSKWFSNERRCQGWFCRKQSSDSVRCPRSIGTLEMWLVLQLRNTSARSNPWADPLAIPWSLLSAKSWHDSWTKISWGHPFQPSTSSCCMTLLHPWHLLWTPASWAQAALAHRLSFVPNGASFFLPSLDLMS